MYVLKQSSLLSHSHQLHFPNRFIYFNTRLTCLPPLPHNSRACDVHLLAAQHIRQARQPRRARGTRSCHVLRKSRRQKKLPERQDSSTSPRSKRITTAQIKPLPNQLHLGGVIDSPIPQPTILLLCLCHGINLKKKKRLSVTLSSLPPSLPPPSDITERTLRTIREMMHGRFG